jgi:hypothetical protein
VVREQKYAVILGWSCTAAALLIFAGLLIYLYSFLSLSTIRSIVFLQHPWYIEEYSIIGRRMYA